MQKILFFDNWGLEVVHNLTRQLQPPQKHTANPLFIADQPWEYGNMQMYGSVLKRPDGPFQMWYSTWMPVKKSYRIFLCYAESDDGLVWRKPLLDIVRHKGQKTNIVLDSHVHGPAIIYDPAVKLYRMIAGAAPTDCICVFNSPDGLHWTQLNQGPVIPNKPDCSMGLTRTRKGHYAAYHRHPSTGRRVCRTTSADFRYWESEPRLVLEPDPHDPPQLQFYALGSMLYGTYEIGTVWTYHTEATDLASWHMLGVQQAELVYSRTGTCWHRSAQGQPFIPHGTGKDWDRGNLQCATQPVLLDNEIRYYYMGTTQHHGSHWELQPQTAGIGMATLKPDRFVALAAGAREGELLTSAFSLSGPGLFINADIQRRGEVTVELLDNAGKPLTGFGRTDADALHGENLAHPVTWRKGENAQAHIGKPVRVRIHARHARLYSIFATMPDEKPVYHQFNAPF